MTVLPSLRQLRYLVAIAEHLHFGRAASSCAVTQSTLSAGIQELEAVLGASLVERTKRRVLLTPLGREVVERSKRLLRGAEDLVDHARGAAEPLAGDLRLGVISTIGPYLLPKVLPRLQQEHPKLRLYLREEQTARLLDSLERGRLDAIILALPYEIGDLETMTLAQDEMLLVCPAGHRLAAYDEVDPKELQDADLLLLEDGHCLRSHALRACRLTDADRREVFHGTSLRTLVPMVGGGLGVTLLPQLAAASELPKDGSIVARKLRRGGDKAREIVLAWRRSSARGAEFRVLGDYLRAALAPSTAGAGRRK